MAEDQDHIITFENEADIPSETPPPPTQPPKIDPRLPELTLKPDRKSGKPILILMLILTVLVLWVLYISVSKAKIVSTVCSLTAQTVEACDQQNAEACQKQEKEFKWGMARCQMSEVIKFSTFRRSCGNLPKPNCEIDEMSKRLCEQRIEKKLTDKSQADCELEYVCPDIYKEYQELLAGCGK